MKVTATVQRSGDWWAVEVPEVAGGFTQAKRLDQVPDMVADAVGLLIDCDPLSVEVDVEVILPDDELAWSVSVTRAVQADAQEATQRAAVASRAAVDALRQADYSTRDVAVLLGVSHQRVSQLAADAAGPAREVFAQMSRTLAPILQGVQDQMAPSRAALRAVAAAAEPARRFAIVTPSQRKAIAAAKAMTAAPIAAEWDDAVDGCLAGGRKKGIVMADKKNVHTVPTDGGWANRREGGERASSTHDTKAEAQAAGRAAAKKDGVEHLIHKKDGTIGDRNSYGNDPHPPKG